MAKISELPALANATGTETVPVITGGKTYRASLADLVEPVVEDVKAVLPLVVPQSRATIVRNTPAATEYAVTIPAVFQPLPNGAWVDFVIPAESLGPIRLSIGDVPTRDIFMATSQRLRAGWIARVEKNDGGGKWNLVLQYPQGFDLVDTRSTAQATLAGLTRLLGVTVAETIDGDPNLIMVRDYPAWVNFAEFEVLIVTTNTAPAPEMIFGDGRRVAISTGGGPIAAGALVRGQIAKFVISTGGGSVVYQGSRPFTPYLGQQPDMWSPFDDMLDAPFGDVRMGSDGKPVITTRQRRIVGRGSSVVTDSDASVGREGAAPPGQAPVHILGRGLDAMMLGTTIKTDNFSHGGHVASQGNAQWLEAMAADASAVDILFDGWGMNDMAPAAYNSGQQSPIYLGNPAYFEAELKARLDGGVKMLIECTSPHTHTGRLTNSFGGNRMLWPYDKAAPVAADELFPPFSQAVTPPLDWTGSGILRPGDARGAHVNAMIRNVVRRLHHNPKYCGRVILLDCEWAWFRYGVETYDLDQLFNAAEIVHPNLLGHQVSYQRCIRDFLAAVRRGRGDQWCFRGDGA
jgi:hypothetical protein